MVIQYSLFNNLNYGKEIDTIYDKQGNKQGSNIKNGIENLEKLLNLVYYTFPSSEVDKLLNENTIVPLYSYIKKEIIEKEITSVSARELLNKKNSDIYCKTLFFLYMTKRYDFSWPFNEEETAKIISYVFFYNTDPNREFYNVFNPLYRIMTTGKYLKSIDLDSSSLSPEKIVNKLPSLFFQLLSKRKCLAFTVIYLLFLKDNIDLKKTLFTKIAAKEISNKTFNKENSILPKLKEIEKYEDYLLIHEESAYNKIKDLCISSAIKKAKLFLLELQNEIQGFVNNQKRFEDLKTIVENKNFHFRISHDCNPFISFTLKSSYKTDKIESLKNKLKVLRNKINIKILNDDRTFKLYTSEIYDILVSIISLHSLDSLFYESVKCYNISFLTTFLKKLELEETINKDVAFRIESIKDVISLFTQNKVSDFLKSAIKSKEEIYNLDTQREIIKRFVYEFKVFLIRLFFFYQSKDNLEQHTDYLTEESFKNFEDLPYYEKIDSEIKSKLEIFSGSINEKKIISLIKELFRIRKRRMFTIHFILLFNNIVHYLKKNNLFTEEVKKVLWQKTFPIGYVLITNELYPTEQINIKKFLNSLKKVTLLASMLKDTLEIFKFPYTPRLSFLFKDNNNNTSDFIQLPHDTDENLFLANLYYSIMPDISDDYVIYIK